MDEVCLLCTLYLPQTLLPRCCPSSFPLVVDLLQRTTYSKLAQPCDMPVQPSLTSSDTSLGLNAGTAIPVFFLPSYFTSSKTPVLCLNTSTSPPPAPTARKESSSFRQASYNSRGEAARTEEWPSGRDEAILLVYARLLATCPTYVACGFCSTAMTADFAVAAEFLNFSARYIAFSTLPRQQTAASTRPLVPRLPHRLRPCTHMRVAFENRPPNSLGQGCSPLSSLSPLLFPHQPTLSSLCLLLDCGAMLHLVGLPPRLAPALTCGRGEEEKGKGRDGRGGEGQRFCAAAGVERPGVGPGDDLVRPPFPSVPRRDTAGRGIDDEVSKRKTGHGT